MKRPALITITSLLTVVLFTAHLAHDFIFGLDSMSRNETFTALLIMLVPSYCAVALSERRLSHVVSLLVGIAAAGMPVLHTVGGPRSTARGFYFVWVLLLLGGTGALCAALSLHELVRPSARHASTRLESSRTDA